MKTKTQREQWFNWYEKQFDSIESYLSEYNYKHVKREIKRYMKLVNRLKKIIKLQLQYTLEEYKIIKNSLLNRLTYHKLTKYKLDNDAINWLVKQRLQLIFNNLEKQNIWTMTFGGK